MIPSSYVVASFRGVLPVDASVDRVGFSLDTPFGTQRFALSVADARTLSRLLADYTQPTFQSESSSGSPSCDGSPHDGQNV